jgi:catechol 2,3-dioxygenase
MVQCQGIAHFSIPVSDLEKSTKFYADVVGLQPINSDGKRYSFIDAGGTCILLCAEDAPINREGGKDLVHHAFTISEEDLAKAKAHLEAAGAEILFEEDRQGGTVNGPRIYFRDPDGTRLEFIKLTSYDTTPR